MAVVPGSAFGDSGKYFVRCSYATSLADLNTAVERIKAFLSEIDAEKYLKEIVDLKNECNLYKIRYEQKK